MQIVESREVHDVIIIGSGASGGMAAYNLTQKGVKVLMLDAGGKFERTKFWTHAVPFEADERLRHGEKPPPFFLDKTEQPYLTPEGKPFNLMRVWGIGGKTNVWGRVSLRMSDIDFGAAERDGWGIPWPIRYADVAPYYDKVEQFIGVLRRWLRHRLVLQLSRPSDSSRAIPPRGRDAPRRGPLARARRHASAARRAEGGRGKLHTRGPAASRPARDQPQRRASERLLVAGACRSRPMRRSTYRSLSGGACRRPTSLRRLPRRS